MLAGELYRAGDPQLVAERAHAAGLMRAYNRAGDPAVLRELLGSVGERSEVRPPFYCDYGANVRIGSDVFVNFNCVALDVVAITIGDRVQIGPNVQLLAADHPRDAAARAERLENGLPITIEDDAWIGGGAILCPGVTVGAGSVVTRDVPPGVVAVGNPCRPR